MSDLGLRRLPYHAGLEAMGWSGKEALGGQLHVTTLRAVFASHALNRATGRLSIFLPTITTLRDTSRGLVRRLEIATDLQTFEFIVWGVPTLIAAIDQHRQQLSSDDTNLLLAEIARTPATVGDSFVVSKAVNLVASNLEAFAGSVVDLVSDPLSLGTLLSLWQLAHAVADDVE
jgi:hypothetical protein